MKKKYLYHTLVVSGISLGIFVIFLYISMSTPLCGDDWAFYNNSMSNGIWNSAVSMYNTWEGRFFTLLAIHAITPLKWLWNVLNPLLYVITFFCMIKMIKPKQYLLSSVLILFLMISIKDEVRMETYSWITGSVYYVLPMMLSFVNLSVLSKYLIDDKYQPSLWEIITLAGTFIYFPLGMENIAFTMLFALIFVIGYRYISLHIWEKSLLGCFLAMLISFTIWYLCPGTAVRMAQLGAWQSYSLLQKIVINLPKVISFTFIDNKYLILILSLAIPVYSYVHAKLNWKICSVLVLVYALACVDLASAQILRFLPNMSILNSMADNGSMYNQIFWLVYTVVLLINLILLYNKNMKENILILFFGLLAACAAAVLFFSPVVGSRLMIYTIYFLMIPIVIMMDRLMDKKALSVITIAACVCLCTLRLRSIYYKYASVRLIQSERIAEIDNYHHYASSYTDGKIWIPRYAIYTVHGGDIEIDDTYHMVAFKTYYGIPQEMEIVFFFKDEY